MLAPETSAGGSRYLAALRAIVCHVCHGAAPGASDGSSPGKHILALVEANCVEAWQGTCCSLGVRSRGTQHHIVHQVVDRDVVDMDAVCRIPDKNR